MLFIANVFQRSITVTIPAVTTITFVSFVFVFNPGFGRCLVYRKQTCLLKRYANQVCVSTVFAIELLGKEVGAGISLPGNDRGQ